MDSVSSFLVEWTIRFLENKDIIRKNIAKIGRNKDECSLVVNYKDKVLYFIVSPVLDNEALNKIRSDGHSVIIVLNGSSNISFVCSNWKRLVEFRFLSIYFVNPHSNLDKVWILNPYIHNKICDKSSLESGLKSMSDMVDPINYAEMKKKLKS